MKIGSGYSTCYTSVKQITDDAGIKINKIRKLWLLIKKKLFKIIYNSVDLMAIRVLNLNFEYHRCTIIQFRHIISSRGDVTS